MNAEDTTDTRRAAANEDGTAQFSRWRRDASRALERAEDARVEVYVRSLLPPPGAKEAQHRVIGDLKRIVRDTGLGEVLVDVWGERLCLCEDCRRTEPGRVLLNRVRELRQWGAEYDASAGQSFERTTQESSVTGGRYEGIVPPRVTAALYVDGTLAGVFPARFGDETVSVSDFCEAIRLVADETDPERVGSRQ